MAVFKGFFTNPESSFIDQRVCFLRRPVLGIDVKNACVLVIYANIAYIPSMCKKKGIASSQYHYLCYLCKFLCIPENVLVVTKLVWNLYCMIHYTTQPLQLICKGIG